MYRYYEFMCAKGHVTEQYIDEEERVITCPHCRNDASRIISSPRIKLEGVSGSFPTAADAWARKHEEATRVAYKRQAEHGD